MSSQAFNGVFIQYGCGLSCPKGWINFDSSPTLRLQKIPGLRPALRGSVKFPSETRLGDIVAGLPVADGSADGVYASHVLEHLSYDDFWTALRNTHRILKPGGMFRLIVPDLEERARRYVAARDKGEQQANDEFMKSAHLGKIENRKGGIKELVRNAFGNSAHLWMWDESSMKAALEKAGFTKVRRCEMGDSGNPAFDAVEDPGRFVDESAQIRECAMEAIKPAA